MTDWTESVLDACDRSGRREGEREEEEEGRESVDDTGRD